LSIAAEMGGRASQEPVLTGDSDAGARGSASQDPALRSPSGYETPLKKARIGLASA